LLLHLLNLKYLPSRGDIEVHSVIPKPQLFFLLHYHVIFW